MIIGYIAMSVIVLFFMWKKYSKKMIDSLGKYDDWMDSRYFWLIFITSLFWIIALPVIGLWRTLDYIYNKLNKQTND